MPKLLQVNVTANWGSTGKIAEGIGAAALTRGWQSAIAYGRMMNPSQSHLIKVGTQRDVYMHYARHRFLDGEGLGSKRATRKFIEQIREYSPDIIHLHNIHDHWLNYPLLFDYLASVDAPVVWTFHDCWAFTGGCAHFEQTGCEKWRTHCIECPKRRSGAKDNSRRNHKLKRESITAISNRLTIVGASEWVNSYAKESFLRDCNFEVIHNGIDLRTFSPADTEARPYILGVSNVWPAYKGLADFFELRKLLPESIGIKIVGLSPEQIKTLPNGIDGQGRTNGVQELVELYSRAKVFVNPTYNDTFPTVNLEALACGTPVVTYRTGGSPEAVDKETGVVVEKGNVDELAMTIQRLIDNPLSGEACRRRAEECFSKDVQFAKYVDLYERLLNY